MEEGADGGGDGQGPQGRIPRRAQPEDRADGQDDVADLADRAVGQKELGVALLHRLDRPDEERHGPDRGDDEPPGPGVERRAPDRGHEEEHSQEAVDAGLAGGRAEEGADRGRGVGVGPRQPELAEGEDARFQAEAGQEEDEEAGERQRARGPELSGHLGQGFAELVAVDEEGPGGDEKPGDLHPEEIPRRAPPARPLPVLEADEEEGGDRHHLPGQGEARAQVVDDGERGHAQDEQGGAKIVAAQAVVREAVHVTDGIDRAHHGHEGHDGEEEAGESVDEQGDLERPGGDRPRGVAGPAEQGVGADGEQQDRRGGDENEVDGPGERPFAGEEGRHGGCEQ